MKPPENYFRVPSWLYDEPYLTLLEREVYAVLLRHCDVDGKSCDPAEKTIAYALGVSTRTVRRALLELRWLGLIRVQQRFNNSNRYTLVALKNPTAAMVARKPNSAVTGGLSSRYKPALQLCSKHIDRLPLVTGDHTQGDIPQPELINGNSRADGSATDGHTNGKRQVTKRLFHDSGSVCMAMDGPCDDVSPYHEITNCETGSDLSMPCQEYATVEEQLRDAGLKISESELATIDSEIRRLWECEADEDISALAFDLIAIFILLLVPKGKAELSTESFIAWLKTLPVENPDLDLSQITPAEVGELLDDLNIVWGDPADRPLLELLAKRANRKLATEESDPWDWLEGMFKEAIDLSGSNKLRDLMPEAGQKLGKNKTPIKAKVEKPSTAEGPSSKSVVPAIQTVASAREQAPDMHDLVTLAGMVFKEEYKDRTQKTCVLGDLDRKDLEKAVAVALENGKGSSPMQMVEDMVVQYLAACDGRELAVATWTPTDLLEWQSKSGRGA